VATLLTNIGLLVTMDPARSTLAGAAVLVADGAIVAIDDEAALAAAHPDAERFDCGGGWVTPGYINGHQHLTGDRLVRSSIPDSLAPGEAIFSWAVPVHAQHQPADDELSALACCAELLRNGVTTVVEAGTVAHPDRVGAAMETIGIRGSVGTWGWDADDVPFAAPAAEVLDRQRAVLDRWGTSARQRVRGSVTLVGHALMSDELLTGASHLASEAGALLTFHISPTSSDADEWMARTGVRPLVHFERLGALGPHVLLAHAVHLDDAEIDALARKGAAVASCPWAYLRLGQGFTMAGRHGELVERGVPMALGTDSENASDQLDILRAAALFVGAVKDQRVDPTRLHAADGLMLATCGGAAAVGLGDVVGSIEPGRRADLVVHDASGPNWWPPGRDPAMQLVWGTDGRSVRHVLVDGEVVVRDRRLTRVDEAELAAAARQAGAALLARAGLA
jgi:5-methylthioadenosine/S-adenosylhomocysteine deaminase